MLVCVRALSMGVPARAAEGDAAPTVSKVFLAPIPYIPSLGGTPNLPLLGGTVNLAVEAKGAPPLSYQWEFNGTPIAGATKTELSLGTLGRSDGGTYRVVVRNSAATVTSPGFFLRPRS